MTAERWAPVLPWSLSSVDLGRAGAQRSATITRGHTARTGTQQAVLSPAESEHVVQLSVSEPMWSSVPCPSYVWVTLGQKRTLAITLPSPVVSQTAWLQPGPWLSIPALGRSQILWALSECNLAENSHLDRRPTLTFLPAARLGAPEVLALGPPLCWDPFLP